MKKLNLIAVSMFLGFSAMAQNTNSLQLTQGKSYNVTSNIQTTSKTSVQGQDMETSINMKALYNMSVAGSQSNQYSINSTIKSIKMEMSQMGMDMKYDSDDPKDASSPLAEGLSSVLNKPQTVKLDNQGNVVKGPADNSADASPILKQFENSGYGTQAAFIALPVNVKVGDTWTVSNNDSGVSNITHYTIKSIDNNLVNLDVSGETKADMTVENQGMEIHTKTAGTFTGTAIVATTGVLQNSKITTSSKGNVEVMGQEMPTETTVVSETTVTES